MIEIIKREGGVKRFLLEGFFSRAAASAQEFLKGTIENTTRATVKWLLGMTVSYLIAAALGVAALVLLLSAAVDGLVATGLPPFAAHLILAVVAAALALFFYLKGKHKKLAESRKEEDIPAHAPGLQVKIVREGPRSRPVRRTRAGRRRRVFDVHPADDRGWEVSSRPRKHKRKTYGTKDKAVKAARKAAVKEEPSQVVVHKADGRIQDSMTYPDSQKN